MTAIPNILLIYTGGTIGMITDTNTGELVSFDFDHIDKHVPELSRLNVKLTSISFDEAIDSSEMNPIWWSKIAKTIFDKYNQFDGFVVLHGSDTMAYSASALSFMLENLRKPVVFTGSQLPIGTIRTDGKENLITAIEIAAAKNEKGIPLIQEVGVYFEYSLYRGNRSSKVSANQFEAFRSPNFQELAIAGVEIDYKLGMINYTQENLPFTIFCDFDPRVALLKLYPGINFGMYTNLFDFEKVKIVIVETFGSGNAPSHSKFQKLITDYITAGGIVINVTQCSSGSVDQGKYKTSSFFQKIGVISGKDMTTEAAIAKAMYLLGKEKTPENIRLKLLESLRGELTI